MQSLLLMAVTLKMPASVYRNRGAEPEHLHLNVHHTGPLQSPAKVKKYIYIPGSAKHRCQDWERVVNAQWSSFSSAFNHI